MHVRIYTALLFTIWLTWLPVEFRNDSGKPPQPPLPPPAVTGRIWFE